MGPYQRVAGPRMAGRTGAWEAAQARPPAIGQRVRARETGP